MPWALMENTVWHTSLAGLELAAVSHGEPSRAVMPSTDFESL